MFKEIKYKVGNLFIRLDLFIRSIKRINGSSKAK
jgi:hypothetical protein